ncbi:MAG: type II toxin-antitoxin system YafQ family toxin [Fidelibacterota bacterium]
MKTYRIHYTSPFRKRAKRFRRRHPEMVKQYEKTLQILEINPSHPSLRLHRLSGKLDTLHSVSINRQYRIMLHFVIKDNLIIPVDVGSHDELY